ncbi:PH domain-containing protein [Janibacter sp. G56]|uniref:PH domain-containing protein n=1 Tax=Janibacter sp. G56 TaxID=3418717 RepID=UPI003CFC09D2
MTPRSTDGWQRFHPLTPFVRGGLILLGVVGYAFSQQVERFTGGGSEPDDAFLGDHLAWAAAVLLLVVAGAVAVGWAVWFASRFRLGEASVELRRGLVFREHRQVRVDRIQAVDITRPLLARLFGLSEVRIESAGGSDSHISLAFLSKDRALEVQDEVLALARRGRTPQSGGFDGGGPVGQQTADGDLAGADLTGASMPGGLVRGSARLSTLLRIPVSRIVLSHVVHPGMLLILLLIPAAIGALCLGWTAALPALLPVLIGVGPAHIGSLLRWWNYELGADDDVVQIRHGLTDLHTSTVPLARVQALQVVQPLWWRPLGWWRVQVNVAGVANLTEDKGAQTTVLPVATLDEALRVADLLVPATHVGALATALTAGTLPAPFVVVPPRARWLDPLVWRRRGYAVTTGALLTTQGRFGRRAEVVPHGKVQSLALSQGPLERRLRLADVTLVSTVGPVAPVVRHLDVAAAHTLLAEQAARSVAAARLVAHSPQT